MTKPGVERQMEYAQLCLHVEEGLLSDTSGSGSKKFSGAYVGALFNGQRQQTLLTKYVWHKI